MELQFTPLNCELLEREAQGLAQSAQGTSVGRAQTRHHLQVSLSDTKSAPSHKSHGCFPVHCGFSCSPPRGDRHSRKCCFSHRLSFRSPSLPCLHPRRMLSYWGSSNSPDLVSVPQARTFEALLSRETESLAPPCCSPARKPVVPAGSLGNPAWGPEASYTLTCLAQPPLPPSALCPH